MSNKDFIAVLDEVLKDLNDLQTWPDHSIESYKEKVHFTRQKLFWAMEEWMFCNQGEKVTDRQAAMLYAFSAGHGIPLEALNSVLKEFGVETLFTGDVLKTDCTSVLLKLDSLAKSLNPHYPTLKYLKNYQPNPVWLEIDAKAKSS